MKPNNSSHLLMKFSLNMLYFEFPKHQQTRNGIKILVKI